MTGGDQGVGADRGDGGGWQCHPPQAFPAPRRPFAGVGTGGASPPSVFVDSVPPNRSSHTRATTEVLSEAAPAPAFH